MPLRFPLRFSLPVFVVLTSALHRADAQQVTRPKIVAKMPALRLQLSPEQPSGIYFERDTLRTRTALLFSLRAWNDENASRELSVWWRIEDAAGRTRWKKRSTMPVGARNFVLRREAWEAPQLGAYRLVIDAQAKGNRKEIARLVWPFSVVSAPRPSYRPRSFFAVSSPTFLSERELDFYARSGVRVLRSPWIATSGDFSSLDSQMQQRLNRKIATWGVLPTPVRSGESSTLANTLARYNAIARWEIFRAPATSQSLSTLPDSGELQLGRLRTISSLLLPLSNAIETTGDGVVVPLPLDENSPLQTRAADSSTVLRALLWAQKRAARKPFYVVQNEDMDEYSQTPRALEAAGFLVRRYVLSIVSGASGMSFPRFSSGPNDDTSVAQNRLNNVRVSDDVRLAGFSRAAAFAAMTRLLEDASRESELFTASPLLWGATFRTIISSDVAGAPQSPVASQVAVIWLDGNARGARLLVRLPAARALDMFGNIIARSQRGVLRVPLSAQPIYVISAAPSEVNARAWRLATVENFQSLQAQLLPLTKIPPPAPPKTNKKTAVKKTAVKKTATSLVSIGQSLRVRLQNVSLQAVTGKLTMQPPSGWKLVQESQSFRLEPGASRIYRFAIAEAQRQSKDAYPVSITADVPRDRYRWKQEIDIASADNVKRDRAITVDGNLDEWRDATWMELKARNQLLSADKPRLPLGARLALRWDDNRLFIAAKVQETSLQPRRAEAASYPFWDDYDAIQLAFGLRDDPQSKPSRAPFRDTDYGFLLSPFSEASADATGYVAPGTAQVESRVLRLWNATIPFGESRDTLRWGGVVPGARCVIRRDERAQVTSYEASFPLNEMPTLRPASRAAGDIPVRFGWILHSDEGRALQWNRATDVFPWWQNTGSFLPSQYLFSAAQTPLGFTQIGDVEPGEAVSAPLPPTVPRVPTTQREIPRLPSVEPMSPRVLPPVKAPVENTLPPAPVRSDPLPQLPPSPPTE